MSFTNTPSSKATNSITAIPTIKSKSTHRCVEMISNTIPRKNTNNTITHRSGCLSVCPEDVNYQILPSTINLLTRGKERLTADVLLFVTQPLGHLILKMMVGGGGINEAVVSPNLTQHYTSCYTAYWV